MIYLASPYTHPEHVVMERRFEEVCRIAARYMRHGLIVYSPVIHCHPIAIRHKLPRDFRYWLKMNHEMIDLSKSVIVLMMDGWMSSQGIADEIAYCKFTNKELTYHDPFQQTEEVEALPAQAGEARKTEEGT